MKAGRISEALPLLLEAHRTQPRNAALCQQLGIAYTQLQQFTEAAQFYRKALSIQPRAPGSAKESGGCALVFWAERGS